ncbi:hypothetical protein WP8S18E04_20130 [Aeromonas caviae]|uniref:hypothetical protein n=1 Tax=Aeromonas caviae TaxID=648 RepID=UPI0015DC6103|nr:hypothetical protein [Aeromonas caviae]BBT66629.1 hypothetical protein WP8S18E04_20130 [Aeromonas caviae]
MSFFKQAKKYGVIVVAGSVALSSPAAFAVDESLTDTIKAALSSGQTNYALVTAGVITMAALGFGVAMIVGWLRK